MIEYDSSGKKRCSKCGHYKNIGEFYKDKDACDKLYSQCKECKDKKSRNIARQKLCARCNISKNLSEFSRKKNNRYKSNCNQCLVEIAALKASEKEERRLQRKLRKAEYYLKNKEKRKKYEDEHKEAIAERGKIYRLKNKERISERDKNYRLKNRDKIIEQRLRYQTENKEMIAERKKKWKAENSDKVKVMHQKRRARKKFLPNTLTVEEWNQTLNDFNHSCANCLSKENLHLDHFFPLAMEYRGTTATNCIPLCSSCNLSKGSKHPKDFFSEEKLVEIARYLISRKILQSPPTVV